jgi:plasmid maintenance system killer protein
MEYTENRRHRKSKSEKMNSNVFDRWQMLAACKEREEMKVLASGHNTHADEDEMDHKLGTKRTKKN